MREILFKAKRVNNSKWIEGYYFYNPNIDKHFVHNWLSGGLVEVNKDTICQYTGLNDKNGNKIWENDIIQLEDRICHIYWFDKNAQFDCKFIKHNKDIVITNFKGVEPREYEDYEVIGNIFDNKDLIGE